jgi:hypothetical protein
MSLPGAAMRRRDFVSLLGAAAVLCSTRSGAQQPSKTYLIGVLTLQFPTLIMARLEIAAGEARQERILY